MRVLMAGGTGFIGGRLARALASRGDEVRILTRSPDRPPVAGVRFEAYADDPIDADVVVNLVGENLFAKRWTKKQKAVIRDSRIDTTRRLVARMTHDGGPRVLIQASAVGWYGDRGDEVLDESSSAPSAGGYLADVCRDWEDATADAESAGVRVVKLRIGVVCGPEGGAIKAMLPPFRFFAGGPVGNGRQWMSWIHADDLVGLALHCIDTEDLSGPVNGTAPNPETMKSFCKALGKAIGRPSWLPVPGFMLRLMLGEVAGVLIGSTKAIPARAQETGYVFKYPEVGPALRDLLG